MRAGSCFSGVGGLDLAVEEAFGATTAWHCELDPNASSVLAARWPGVPNLGDITAVDWSTVEPVDIICGGSPCQDLSSAGSRKGMRSGTRSGLWASMCRAIEVVRPRFVIWENVRGALSACAASDLEPCPGCVGDGSHQPVLRALGRVLGDLADLGFDAEWQLLPASAVGACHRRDRVFVVAWRATEDAGRVEREAVGRGETDWPEADRSAGEPSRPDRGVAADSTVEGRPRAGVPGRPPVSGDGPAVALLPTPRTSDTNGSGEHGTGGVDLRTAVALLPTPRVAADRTSRSSMLRRDSMSGLGLGQAVEVARGILPRELDDWSQVPGHVPADLLPTPTTGYTSSTAEEWRARRPAGNGATRELVGDLRIVTEELLPTPTTAPATGNGHARNLAAEAKPDRWGRYAAAIARHEAAFGRIAPDPTDEKGRLSPVFVEWMMGLPAGWVTDLLTRAPALRALGNGVVPAQAVEAIGRMLTRSREAAA